MFTLDDVVPWGRSYEEYCRMFALGEQEFAGRILACADGPASFNAGATHRGGRVVSCDPIYEFGAAEIRRRIDETSGTILEQTRLNRSEFVWTEIRSPEDLLRIRLEAMEEFLADYGAGREQGRYRCAALPLLPFDNQAFDLAICSHFLFLYSDRLDADFHLASLRELCRVAREIRVFPLLALGGARSSYVDIAVRELRRDGVEVAIERVPYEFQRGGNEMLRAKAGSCLQT